MKSVIMNPNDHDSKLSSLSHMPHLVSSILSHSLYNEIDEASALCGQGLRDTVRIAGGSLIFGQELLKRITPIMRKV